MKTVYLARNPGDAYLMKGLLEGEGIEAEIRGEFLWGVRGEVPITPDTCPSVVVADSDYERAAQFVTDFLSAAPPAQGPGGEWKCGRCGESNEPLFTECWHCGAAR